jgi:hypothetical protein
MTKEREIELLLEYLRSLDVNIEPRTREKVKARLNKLLEL